MLNNKIKYSDIVFDYKEDKLDHNLEFDYGLFAIWQDAIPFIGNIKSVLLKKFEIVLESEVVWSNAKFHENASRLYEEPIFSNIKPINRRSGHVAKIKNRKFVLFIVKDHNPDYSYNLSVSKKVEITNNNFRNIKYEFRELAFREGGTKYSVHSTNNILEFFSQAPLILGLENFFKIINGEKLNIKLIEKDLEGAGGWKTWVELISVLNTCGNYLFLRNFDDFPLENKDQDIDLLVESYQKIASVLGMEQSKSKPFKGVIIVDNMTFSVDLRFIGDNYYDRKWQVLMLDRKTFFNGFYIPRIDDYFFSLLYHCKVQKNTVKTKYVKLLENIALKLGYNWFNKELLSDDKSIGVTLSGFYKANNYYFETPIDPFVINNKCVSKYLPTRNSIFPVESKKKFLKRKIIQVLPRQVVSYLKRALDGMRSR